MFDRLLKMSQVLNMVRLYMQGLCRVRNMPDYGSNAWIYLNIPEYALISLNMPEPDWMLLNVSEYAWKFLNKLFWLCQGSEYAAT